MQRINIILLKSFFVKKQKKNCRKKYYVQFRRMHTENNETKKIVAQVPVQVKAEFSKQAVLENKSEGELAGIAIKEYLGKKK